MGSWVGKAYGVRDSGYRMEPVRTNHSLVGVEGRCTCKADSKEMAQERREKPEGVSLGNPRDQMEGAHTWEARW